MTHIEQLLFSSCSIEHILYSPAKKKSLESYSFRKIIVKRHRLQLIYSRIGYYMKTQRFIVILYICILLYIHVYARTIHTCTANGTFYGHIK